MNSALQHRTADQGAGPQSLPSDWELRIGAVSGAGRVVVVPAAGGTLGADPGCTLPVTGEGVAGVHLRIARRPDGALGWESATSASVLLDGQPARSGPLVDGSRLQLGAVVVTVVRRPVAGLPSFPSAPPEPPDQLLPPGTVLGERYRIEEVIGQGGMGTVYRAQHLTLGKTFAVKVLKGMHSARPDFVARFQREAVAASQIRHPGIVDVLDFGRAVEGSFYCVMEYLQGETLAARVARQGALPVAEAVRVGRDMARALTAAHTQGIFHRDIKPENVLLVPVTGGPDTVKLVDFGIARLVDPARNSRETGEGVILGTPQYMSPEQASGLSQDARADIYSLGVLLWELLAGVPPFHGASATHVLAAHLLEPAPRLPHTGPHGPIPRRLGRLLTRMMAKRPEDRPARMQDVVAELDAVLAPAGPRVGWAATTLGLLAVASAAGALALFVARHRQRPPAVVPAAQAAPLPAPASLSAPPAVLPQAPTVVAVSPAPRVAPAVAAVDISSEPPGAEVVVGGRPRGVTPLKLVLRQGAPQRLEVSRLGYASETRLLRPSPGLSIHLTLQPLARPSLPDLKESPY
jgi:eukaryotic-like serine/threonine-protein kinase